MQSRTATVLVADDSRATSRALSALLTAAGFEVEQAADGAEALRRATAPHIGLVLLDLALPELDGLQVLRTLRAREDKRLLPVIVVTSNADPAPRLAALQLGADDVLLKPWDDAHLLARIRRCLDWKAGLDGLQTKTSTPARFAPDDPLSRLVPREILGRRLAEELRRAQRYADPLSLVLLAVVTKDGPPKDALLTGLAEVLPRALRDTDVLAWSPPAGFAVMLPKTSLAGALTAAERLLAQARSSKHPGLQAFSMRAGVAGFPHRMVNDAQGLWDAAEGALRQARAAQGDRICLHSHALQRRPADGESPPSPGRF